MQLRNTETRKAAATLVALLATTPTLAHADFYDGQRGPTSAQVHSTLSLSESGVATSLALKYFGDDIAVIGVANANENGYAGSFLGVGYLCESWERMQAMPLLGYGVSPDVSQGNFISGLQVTVPSRVFVFDANYFLNLAAHGNDEHSLTHTLGATPSVGNERFRIGPQVNYPIGGEIDAQILMRYDIDTQSHTSWVEFGIGPNGGQIQFRGNF